MNLKTKWMTVPTHFPQNSETDFRHQVLHVVPLTNIFLQCVCHCLRDIYAFFFVLLSQA